MSFVNDVILKMRASGVPANEIVHNSLFDPALNCHGDSEGIFRHFILKRPVQTVLEIGTYNGLSAGFLAQFAKKVYTIDIEERPVRKMVFKALGVEDKVISYIVKTEAEKKDIIESISFDLAFIDGDHFGNYPQSNFEMVKHCGRVIFHDYHKNFPGVVRLVDSLGAEKRGVFAYWEDSMNPRVMFPEFNYNLQFVEKFISGKGLDMGCGCCPLIREDCLHIDHSPQPKAFDLVPKHTVIHGDAVSYVPDFAPDYIFSSHMVEDLESEQAIIDCLNGWGELLKPGGYIVLLLPDMQGGRYPTVAEGGNPSHKVDVGVEFFNNIKGKLNKLEIVQIDTILHDKSSTFDIVLQKIDKKKKRTIE